MKADLVQEDLWGQLYWLFPQKDKENKKKEEEVIVITQNESLF